MKDIGLTFNGYCAMLVDELEKTQKWFSDAVQHNQQLVCELLAQRTASLMAAKDMAFQLDAVKEENQMLRDALMRFIGTGRDAKKIALELEETLKHH